MIAHELIKQLEDADPSLMCEVWLSSSGHDFEPIKSAIRAVGERRIMLYGEPDRVGKQDG